MILALAAQAATLAIRADEVRPVDGPPIAGGVVLIEGDRIVAVGAGLPVPDGVRVLTARVATPGFVDGLTTAGLTGPLNQPSDQDHREPGDPVAPELRALDGFDPDDPLLAWVRRNGVTTVQAGPSPGAPVGGRALVAHTAGGPADAALVADGPVVFTLGEAPKGFPGSASRMGAAARIREALAGAREYVERRALPLADRPPLDLGREALADVLARRRRALVVAETAADLETALRLGHEFGLDLVLVGAAEGWTIAPELAAAGVPVLVGPAMSRTWSESETRNASFANAAILADAGVRVGLSTGYESYVPKVRVATFEAQIAAREGLGAERALRLATLGTAEILGVADRVGSLTPGKLADVVLFDGEPLEAVTRVCAVVVAGVVTDEGCR